MAARTMERVAMMDVNCILAGCMEDESLEVLKVLERCLESY